MRAGGEEPQADHAGDAPQPLNRAAVGADAGPTLAAMEKIDPSPGRAHEARHRIWIGTAIAALVAAGH